MGWVRLGNTGVDGPGPGPGATGTDAGWWWWWGDAAGPAAGNSDITLSLTHCVSFCFTHTVVYVLCVYIIYNFITSETVLSILICG